MTATMATLAGFPALIMAWYLDLNWGLNRMALRAAMSRAFLARARPPRIDRFPRVCPLSLATGARPTRLAACGWSRRPSSGVSTTSTFAVPSPKLGMLVKMAKRSLTSASVMRSVLRRFSMAVDLAVDLAQPLSELTFDEV